MNEKYTQDELQQIISRAGIDRMIEETGLKQFVVRCPTCLSEDVKCIADPLLNKLVDKDRRYTCNECGVVFTWEEAELEMRTYEQNKQTQNRLPKIVLT
jgi:transposase-like protein